MTDGKPSDPVDARVLPGALAEALRVLHEACPKVSVQLLGFGEADTRTLEAMVAALARVRVRVRANPNPNPKPNPKPNPNPNSNLVGPGSPGCRQAGGELRG